MSSTQLEQGWMRTKPGIVVRFEIRTGVAHPISCRSKATLTSRSPTGTIVFEYHFPGYLH